MCGILIFTPGAFNNEDIEYLRSEVAARGPDHYGSMTVDDITLESSVLSLRLPFTSQPLQNSGSVFCYNGQIYNLPMNYEQDTQFAFDLVRRGAVEELLNSEGEFAFAYYSNRSILFGRDIYGRRSLLYHLDNNGGIIISSVGDTHHEFTECDGGGVIYRYSLDSKTVERIQLPIARFTINPERSVVKPENSDVENCDKVLHALMNAVTRRTVRPNDETSVAVMFSGGIDCTIIAALLDDILPSRISIELLNVAFENKRTGSLWDTPDRLLAHRSLAELKKRSKGKQPHSSFERFQLVEINVPYSKTQENKPRVQSLMAPSTSVMDLSIALAFYFTAQPQNGATTSTSCLASNEPRQNRAPRILFSGLGADELFAGYSRHITAAAQSGQRLADELALDFERLPHRNLGRDDRVCASWGREVRYPFLDKEVVDLASKLPLNYKIDDMTTKVVLRSVAATLGFEYVVHEKKRAIQFGARSAKMDPGSGNAKGHHTVAAV